MVYSGKFYVYVTKILKIHIYLSMCLHTRAHQVNAPRAPAGDLKRVNQIEVVLVCSICSNRIPQMGWLVNNRNLFLMVLETGHPRSNVGVVGGGPSSGSRASCWVPMSWQGPGNLVRSLIGVLIPS